MEGAVVVGAHQHRIELGALAGQAQDQVGAGLAALLEGVFLHLPLCGQLLVEVGTHTHQPQPVPLGVAGAGQLVEVGEQAVLEGGAHAASPVSSSLQRRVAAERASTATHFRRLRSPRTSATSLARTPRC